MSRSRDVHSTNLDNFVNRIVGPTKIGGDTYANRFTPLAARLAAGSTIAMALEVAQDKAHNGFAIVRPPGHHAEKDKICGFCLYNNCCAAAQAVLNRTSKSRILIVDWDVHQVTECKTFSRRILVFCTWFDIRECQMYHSLISQEND